MLAYLFWHRPREAGQAAEYEAALEAFHHSLARSAPAGMLASASYRLPEAPPWMPAPAYEDWYVLQDWAALGVLNEAAVGRGHRGPHEHAARMMSTGAGAIYALLEGEAAVARQQAATLAVWVDRPPEKGEDVMRAEVAELLADGMQTGSGSVWRRQLVLGPAPELCIAGAEVPSGARATRLPAGWSANVVRRETVFGG